MKEIQDEFADDPASQGRFLREAEVNGRLEHPSIVPVYGLGRHADGRPYYAMRFIRGESLQEAIDAITVRPLSPLRGRGVGGEGVELPGPKPLTPDPSPRSTGERGAERNLEFRQLLTRFIAVCNAVAYAHSRGVLHRDIKPANVMLGKFGETLLVDWGLAKVMGQPESAPREDEPALGPSGDGMGQTQQGAVLGTPAFMAPEQAAGQLDQVGPASDIYSLGATLYVLLTGRAPFTDPNIALLLAAVQMGEYPRPSQVKPGVAPALEAICRKAMALQPGDRYESAAALAGDVEHWLADEPVSAWREPWGVRARCGWAGIARCILLPEKAPGRLHRCQIALRDQIIALGALKQPTSESVTVRHNSVDKAIGNSKVQRKNRARCAGFGYVSSAAGHRDGESSMKLFALSFVVLCVALFSTASSQEKKPKPQKEDDLPDGCVPDSPGERGQRLKRSKDNALRRFRRRLPSE